jgi:hypothetical protein
MIMAQVFAVTGVAAMVGELGLEARLEFGKFPRILKNRFFNLKFDLHRVHYAQAAICGRFNPCQEVHNVRGNQPRRPFKYIGINA